MRIYTYVCSELKQSTINIWSDSDDWLKDGEHNEDGSKTICFLTK